MTRIRNQREENLMDTSSKLISKGDSGVGLEMPRGRFGRQCVSVFQNLLPRQRDLTMYLLVNHKT